MTLIWVQILGLVALCLKGTGSLAALRVGGKATNSVEGVEVQCSGDALQLTVKLAQPFEGLLHARGFPVECATLGRGERVLSLVLPTAGCGVRLAAGQGDTLRWLVAVDVQFDRQLQLAADERRLVSCPAPNESVVASEPLSLPKHMNNRLSLPEEAVRGPSPPLPLRSYGHVTSTDFDNSPTSQSGGARFWMKLEADRSHDKASALVGEPVTMNVHATLPAGLSMRVTDCRAHDGTGDSAQQLSDRWGCSLEPQILPQLTYSGVRPDLSQVASAVFPAFKFPDRESLHLQCVMLLCRGECPLSRCKDGSWPVDPDASVLPPGKVVGRLEVYNSVRVAAPGIELEASAVDMDNFSNAAQREEKITVSGERSLCISPSRMALALGVLGAVLLCAVAAALYSATRGRSRKSRGIVPSVLSTARPLPYIRVLH